MELKENLSQFDFSQPVNLDNSPENFDSVEKVIKKKLFSHELKLLKAGVEFLVNQLITVQFSFT